MPRKHKEPKPRNIEKIKRKREKRKAEKNQLLIESGYAAIPQSEIPHQKQAEFVALNEYPGLKIQQNEKEKDLWYVEGEDGFHLRVYQLNEILRKFRYYSGRELSKYEMIQEIQWQLRYKYTNDEVKDVLDDILLK